VLTPGSTGRNSVHLIQPSFSSSTFLTSPLSTSEAVLLHRHPVLFNCSARNSSHHSCFLQRSPDRGSTRRLNPISIASYRTVESLGPPEGQWTPTYEFRKAAERRRGKIDGREVRLEQDEERARSKKHESSEHGNSSVQYKDKVRLLSHPSSVRGKAVSLLESGGAFAL
jgi:hypothetical protein